jgi:tetratricopeptide (TPR) repeat protein
MSTLAEIKLPRTFVFLILAAAVLSVYSQVLQHQFVFFDDDGYILRNIRVNEGLTWSNLLWSFTAFEMANWHPLTWISYMIDNSLWGTDAGLTLFQNVLLHTICTDLLFLLLTRLGASSLVALLLTAFWALHPINVESVAWASQRKTGISTIFLFLAILAYLRYARSPNWKTHTLISVYLLLSLLAKPMAVTLPAVFLLLDGWPLRRINYPDLTPRTFLSAFWPLIREKLIWIGIIAAVCVVTVIAQKGGGAVVGFQYLSVEERLENAIFSYATYLWQLVVPLNLSIIYYYRPTPIDTIIAAFAIAGISYLCLRIWRRNAAPATGWAMFLGTMVPVIGIIQVGSQSMADRYLYVPMVGLLIALIPVLDWILRRLPKTTLSIAVACLAILSVLTYQQTSRWKNSETLFTHSVRIAGPHPFLMNNLGVYYLSIGQARTSIPFFTHALQALPDHAITHANLGYALTMSGSPELGITFLREALRIKPDDLGARMNHAFALTRLGFHQEALDELRDAISATPTNHRILLSSGLYYRGMALEALGRYEEALSMFQNALELNPLMSNVLNDLGTLYTRMGRIEEAEKVTLEAIRLNPRVPEYLFNLGALRNNQGKVEDAEFLYRAALDSFPGFHPARSALAALMLDQRRIGDALAIIRPMLGNGDANVRREGRLLNIHSLKLLGRQEELAAAIEFYRQEFPEHIHLLERLQEHWTRMGM